MLAELCAGIVADGALSCVIVSPTSGERTTAGREHADHPELLDLLAGRSYIDNAFVGDMRRATPESIGELAVRGNDRTVFAGFTPTRAWIVLIVLPAEIGAAVGWALLRRAIAGADGGQR